MKLRMITVAVLVALMSLLLAPAQTSAKPKPGAGVPIPVSGDKFKGQFRLESVAFTTDNAGNTGLSLIGDLLGADGQLVSPDYENFAWPVDMAATRVGTAPAATTGDINALVTCEILELVLAPLHLELLGLVVDLSRVVLTITGETGALLGDLLCGLLGGGILDLPFLQGLLTQLNTLLGNLGGVIGGLIGLAILDSIFQLTNFTRVGNQILANGTIGGLAASGPVDLAASNGTCEILNLVLGPLHLDLLGLVIDLNRVTLTITAEQGGGLLGDLLCSVADLLGGPASLTGLTALLNNILRALGGA
jgi:hypothetical protein